MNTRGRPVLLERVLLVGMVLTCSLLATMLRAATASAGSYTYCNVLVPAFTACPNNHSSQIFRYNEARYPGSGNVSVCQRVDFVAYGGNFDRYCATNFVDDHGDLASNTGTYFFDNVGNNSAYTHTIVGYTFW